jgi:superfamily II DNA/RNA helicase
MVPTRELALQVAALATLLGQRPSKKRRRDALSRIGGTLKSDGGVTAGNYSAVEAAVADAAATAELDWSVEVAKGEISAGGLAALKSSPPNLLVGTPQALVSLVPQHVGLSLTGYVVLDEIDSLLMPGMKTHAVDLLRAVRRITRRRDAVDDSLSQYTPLRTVLCGAYPSTSVLDFAQSWLRTGYKSIDLNVDGSVATHTGPPQRSSAAAAGKLPPHVRHGTLMCSDGLAAAAQLVQCMKHGKDGRVSRALVFANSTAEVEEAADVLQAAGIKAVAFTNSTGYQLRRRAMRRMEEGGLTAIVCTDMLARGIDIPRLTHVVNYGVPHTPQAYYHRSGRVGRLRPAAADRQAVSPKEGHVVNIVQWGKEAQALLDIQTQLGVHHNE